jgi:uncharacterized protein (DUF1015 family)
MPQVYPFCAVQYATFSKGPRADLSAVIAPPYDVLDAQAKAALMKKSDHNIVAVDLPHIPAKELGPPIAYENAAKLYASWLRSGVLKRSEKPAMWVYRETFTFAGKTHARTGMVCTLSVQPLGPRAGGGILPHEETFSGPKEDRMALMKATATQLSPIFGLHADDGGRAANLLTTLASRREPDAVATSVEGTLHECWTITDPDDIKAYQDALAQEDIFIADGHHRYNTALNYLKHLEGQTAVPDNHPSRRCMFVLISMSDSGMVIGPTHRVLGGMSGYSWDAFAKAAAPHLTITPAQGGLSGIEAAMDAAAKASGCNALGLYDFASGRAFVATPTDPDPLKSRFPAKVHAWRTLDVALVQHLIVEHIAQPALNSGQPVKWAFPHSIAEVEAIGAGQEMGSGGGKGFSPQLAVIVRPTPLQAVRDVSRASELMPQKSTFFYPKLATGLFMNPLS